MTEDPFAPSPQRVAPLNLSGYGKTQPRRRGAWLWLLVIIGFLPLIQLLFVHTHRESDALFAIQTIRTIYQAEVNYKAAYPQAGYACSLATLGGDPSSGAPTAQAAELIDPALAASGQKNRYTFALTCSSKTSYRITGVPRSARKTGDPGYCVNEDGLIKIDPTGGTNCTDPLQ